MNNRLNDALEENGLKLVSLDPYKVCFIDNDKEFVSGPAAEKMVKEALADYTEDVKIGEDVPDDCHVLVKWDGNWADEMDLSSFCVFDGPSWNAYRKELEDHDMEMELYIGTNEELSFDNGKDLLSEMSVQFITAEEAEVINKLFDGSHDQAGVFSIELENEEEEEEEDEDYNEDEDTDSEDEEDDRPYSVVEMEKKGWILTVTGEKTPEGDDIYHGTHPDGSEMRGTDIMWSLS